MAKPTPLPPLSFLLECFTYDALTGETRWKRRPERHFTSKKRAERWNAQYAGRLAGRRTRFGYLQVTFTYSGKVHRIMLHRIVFFMFTALEAPELDHRNRIRDDNRFRNLRPATRRQNRRNTGPKRVGVPKGVHFDAGRQRFCAQAVVEGKTYNLGRYLTAEEAHAAYCRFTKPIYGEFFRAEA